MTSSEMRDMAQEYANVDEVAATCLNALADLTDTLVNEVNNIWRVLEEMRSDSVDEAHAQRVRDECIVRHGR